MRKNLAIVTLLIAMAVGCYLYATQRVREVVILSTNDMHAAIDNFPRLATAVRECRDTVECVLVDAGDRWTGNSYVDLADGRLPIIDLMNEVGYDVVTLGNHEFDMGHALLQRAIEHSSFGTICSNMLSSHAELKTLPQTTIFECDNGLDIGFAGVVTNYDHGHPDGDDSRFVGLEFADPMEAARRAAEALESADVKVLLSHIADAKDAEFAAADAPYDVIVSGHSHNVVDTLVGKTVIGQTGKNLLRVGATHIRMRGNRVESIEYKNYDLSDYAESADIARRVEEIKNNPFLNETIGTITTFTDRVGFANMECRILKEAIDADLAFYHYGGIRITEFEPGTVSRARLFDLEPFGSMIVERQMSVAELEALIREKFNDKGNAKESHRIDLFCTEPYDIVVGADGEAVAVRFPTLRRGKMYRVAMPDYVSKKYPTLVAEEGKNSQILVLDRIIEYVERHSPLKTDNRCRQRIVRR